MPDLNAMVPEEEARLKDGLGLLPPFAPFGITRAGDITDLDIIGIPVWFAVRPNSRALSMSQGKGLTHEQARISAVMESIEGAVAEQTGALIEEYGTPGEMLARGRQLVPFHELARCRWPMFDWERKRAWVRGFSYPDGDAVFAPYELVGVDMRSGLPWDSSAFEIGSSGLAAGPSFEFAASAALLELIERDAIAPVETLGFHADDFQPLRIVAGQHAGLDQALAKIRAAGLDAHLYAIPSDVGLPVAGAIITRPILGKMGGGERLSGGFACRLSMGDAALSALLEAVQSRLTNIAGGRDDLHMSEYDAIDPDQADLSSSIVFSHEPFGADLTPCSLSPSQKLDHAITKLQEFGCSPISCFDLPTPVQGVHVVRALVPGLQAAIAGEDGGLEISRPGERA
ncbi:YcaO-like family protein [Labrys neptuniae]